MNTTMKVSEIKISYSPKHSEVIQITDSMSAFKVISNCWNHRIIQFQEEFKVLYLNQANHVLGIYHASKGGISSSVVDVRILFSVALKCNSSGMIIAHNHPSGNLKTSKEDINITNKIKEVGNLLNIVLLDHLILSKDSYYSFADNGLL